MSNLPDDPGAADSGNEENLTAALSLYRDAITIFEEYGEIEKAAAVKAASDELKRELAQTKDAEAAGPEEMVH